MFKSMLKRSWLSIIRKPSRTIILALILFAMANLVLATIAIKGTVNESTKYAKETLGGTVYLQADVEKLHDQMMSEMSADGKSSANFKRVERPTVPVAIAKEIAESEYVKDYTFSINSLGDASGFTPVETDTPSRGGGMSAIGGSPDRPSVITGDLSIQGINSYAFIDGVQNGTMKLSSGEYFDETSADKVIISYDLAAANDLKSGDKIKVQNVNTSKKIELEIVGIYDTTDNNHSLNTIYMNVDTAAKFLSSENYNSGDYGVNNVQYFLVNAEDSDDFITKMKARFPEIESSNLQLTVDDTAYTQMVGPIESVGSFANTILWVVIVASVVIITLIVTINIKDRRYEMGVLLSLGANKANIIGQILIELAVVGTLAFGLSTVTGSILAKSMGSSLLDQQLSMSKETTETTLGRGSHAGHGNMMKQMQQTMNGQKEVEPIAEINVSASPEDYAILFGVGYLVLVISLLIPAASILRYEPKTILTGKE